MPTLLQIVSDIHLEFRNQAPVIHPHAPNLALLGDIGKPFMTHYKRFIHEQSDQFEHVFVLMGNHEYYHNNHTVNEILSKARQICNDAPKGNVHLLERDSFDLTDDTTLLGCTLWSDIDIFTSKNLNDFCKIKTCTANGTKIPLTRSIYRAWHERDVNWLHDAISQQKSRGRRVIVLTHHGPHSDMSGQYVNTPISSGFTTDLHELFNDPVIALASGHVHSNVDMTLNGVRSVSNAIGYPDEKTVGYKENVVIQVL